jgi:hypothetical protein
MASRWPTATDGEVGIFREWQPKYAARDIPTVPVRDDKRPATRGYHRVGPRGSADLASRPQFRRTNVFGYVAGPRSGITAVDVDSKDPELLVDVRKRFGETPVEIETSRGWHLLYRYNGERRMIKPDPAVPIDIIGSGLLIAPPSRIGKSEYKLARGTLDDLKDLPPIHAVLDGLRRQSRSSGPIPSGRRDDTIFRYALEQAPHVDTMDDLLDVLRTRNMDCETPLPDDVIIEKAVSAWGYENRGTNLVGRGRAMIVEHDTYDALEDNPNALRLLMRLQRVNWHRDRFVLANAMAEELHIRRSAFYEAREALVRQRIIACLHEGGRGPNVPPIYAWLRGRR